MTDPLHAEALDTFGRLLEEAGATGMAGWSRRVTSPLARTRESVKEDLQWVKQRIG